MTVFLAPRAKSPDPRKPRIRKPLISVPDVLTSLFPLFVLCARTQIPSCPPEQRFVERDGVITVPSLVARAPSRVKPFFLIWTLWW